MQNTPNAGIPKRVKEVVYDAVIEITSGDPNVEFTPKEVCDEVLNKYPDFNRKNSAAPNWGGMSK